jgi:hypothetical protein
MCALPICIVNHELEFIFHYLMKVSNYQSRLRIQIIQYVGRKYNARMFLYKQHLRMKLSL